MMKRSGLWFVGSIVWIGVPPDAFSSSHTRMFRDSSLVSSCNRILYILLYQPFPLGCVYSFGSISAKSQKSQEGLNKQLLRAAKLNIPRSIRPCHRPGTPIID
ncbi:hypothetical protein F5X96DRAFT_650452 [Biscogniauxia mediterranea]|nr:hypothetical protein F5X96DRAFT_650452 [Biscogniauxia mediterranea]